jgi:chemotaxis protein CheX
VDVRLINPFIQSTMSVFALMLNCKLTRGEPRLKQKLQPEFEVSGIIGLSGKAKGTVVVSLERETALRATEAMLTERPEGINEEVVDAVGELANMIAGRAKATLEEFEMKISLPLVVAGKNKLIGFPSNTQPICIPFSCEWGQLSVDVGICTVEADCLPTASLIEGSV